MCAENSGGLEMRATCAHIPSAAKCVQKILEAWRCVQLARTFRVLRNLCRKFWRPGDACNLREHSECCEICAENSGGLEMRATCASIVSASKCVQKILEAWRCVQLARTFRVLRNLCRKFWRPGDACNLRAHSECCEICAENSGGLEMRATCAHILSAAKSVQKILEAWRCVQLARAL